MWISCTRSCWLWLFCPAIPSAQCFISFTLSTSVVLPPSLLPFHSMHSLLIFLPHHSLALFLLVHLSLLWPLTQFAVHGRKGEVYVSSLKTGKKRSKGFEEVHIQYETFQIREEVSYSTAAIEGLYKAPESSSVMYNLLREQIHATFVSHTLVSNHCEYRKPNFTTVSTYSTVFHTILWNTVCELNESGICWVGKLEANQKYISGATRPGGKI